MAKLSRIPSGLDDPKLLAIEFALGFDVDGNYTFDDLAAVPIGSVHPKAAQPRSAIDLAGSWGSSASLDRSDHSLVTVTNAEEESVAGTISTAPTSGTQGPDDNTLGSGSRLSDAATLEAPAETGATAPNSATIAALAVDPVFETRVASSADDAEERSSGSTSLTSSDLELAVDDGVGQTVGIRFTGIDIPKGAIITNAYIQFTVDEVSTGTISLLIRGQDVDDAAAFAATTFNVTSRPATDASIAWTPADWAVRGEAGAAQRTPDLSAIIQEIVSRDGWAALNDMVFLITGSGTRTARAYDGSPTAAPLLHVEYTLPTSGDPVVFNTPADADPVANEIAELAAAGTAIGITASAADPTPGDTITYSVDDARFAIDANGVITRSDVGTLDFETQTSITLTVTATSSDFSRAYQTFTVSVLNTQEPVAFGNPADSDPTADRIAQNAAAGTRVGITASARDPDAGSTVTYGLNDPRFAIDGNGVITRSAIGTLDAQAESAITLRVTATSSDGSIATQDYTIIISPPATDSVIFERRVVASLDDVEEAPSGSVSATSGDLELTVDGAKVQTVGMRFTGIDIPKGAIITNAYIQFTVDQVSTGAASLMIRGQDVDDAAAFTTAQFNVSSRTTTDASVAWTPADWTTRGAAGLAQRTPDLKAIVQEIVDRDGWAALNDMVLLVTGTGTRTARAFDGNVAAAPLLHVEYYVLPTSAPVVFNTPPDADPADSQIAELAAAGTAIGITASAGDPDAGSTVTYSIDDARFSIGSNGVITRSGIGTLDFETQSSITLTVTATSSDRSTASQTFTLGILDSPEPIAFNDPADADTANNRIVQSAAAGTRVGITASARDPDAGSTISYSLTDNRFAIDANGVITRSATGTLNAQTEPSIALRVTATSSDGSTATHDYTVNVAAQAGPQTLYRFAVFGDFGDTSLNGEKAVAALVHNWNVDFILTVGDNVYAPQTLDAAVGQQYHDYVGNYQGAYGAGSAINRFFPVLGNHEYNENNVTNYLNYFTLPDNERYYDFQIGPVHFFALNSNKQEADGRSATSVQGQWMHSTLDASNASFNVAYFHHTPYNPGGSTSTMRWPFEPWGVNAVFAGHEHNYYRENRDDNGDGLQLPYTTTGLGGAGRDVPNVGANLVTITDQGMLIEFYNVTSFNGTTATSSLTDSYFIATPTGRVPTIVNGGYVLNGTTGADYLWGLGSNATLTGGRGNDTLVGGKDSNRFVFQTGDGNDAILNFRAGAATGDVLDLRAFGIDSASEFRQVASNQGANVVANLSGTDHLTLLGVHAEQLHDDNFVRAGLLV
ncbi:metallophosphoesterase [Ensifer sesbaniae]|uniref:metallophosphoesterase n=1 Tax=Ensifer sesbaniae TaxID=1214071 RepID=UPI0015683072|nr:metallophosphoesterase [Ensifer sesbaniae]NRQ18359.1 Alkaline phosphatase [Ensifer sesbaniae]